MAKTIRQGYYIPAGGGAVTVHSAAGRLIALLVSHAQATVQSSLYYDNTAASGTLILSLQLDPTRTPIYIELPRDQAIPFDTGLTIDPGNCNILVWSVDHG